MTAAKHTDTGFSSNNKISLRQLQALLLLEIFGFGVTSLPRRVAEHAAQDGWLSVVAAALFIVGIAAAMAAVTRRFTGQGLSFYALSCKVLGRPLGVAVTIIICARLVAMASLNLRIFAEITRQTMLPQTPFPVIFAAMLLLAAYGASKGIESRARVAEVLILLVFVPLIIVFAASSRQIDFTNLAPVLDAPIRDILSGSFSALFAFSGIEALLIIGPFLSRPKGLVKSSTQAVGIIGICMIAITAITIARFGPVNIVHQMWPVIKMMDTASLPGAIIDRQGALIMTFWIISAYATVGAALFFSSLLLKDVAGRGKHPTYILILIPIIAFAANFPANLAHVYELLNLANTTLGVATIVVIPLLLFAVSSLRRRLHE